MAHEAKIVTLDIETAPLVGFTWGTWKQTIGLNQILCDWSILSYCAKWFGKREVLYNDCAGRGESLATQDFGVRDDRHLLTELWEILDKADLVIMQNGVKFDRRKINARFILAGMQPPSPYRIIDTMLEARKVAAFTSNRLAWLSEFLTDTKKDEHREFPGFELWTECLKDNPRAWKVMRKYNCRDTPATEKVYLKLRPWIDRHPNVAAYDDSEKVRCPKCGGAVVKNGNKPTNTGMYQQYRCKVCGGHARGRYTQNSITKRKSLLTSL